jgi:hypothetical protein
MLSIRVDRAEGTVVFPITKIIFRSGRLHLHMPSADKVYVIEEDINLDLDEGELLLDRYWQIVK